MVWLLGRPRPFQSLPEMWYWNIENLRTHKVFYFRMFIGCHRSLGLFRYPYWESNGEIVALNSVDNRNADKGSHWNWWWVWLATLIHFFHLSRTHFMIYPFLFTYLMSPDDPDSINDGPLLEKSFTERISFLTLNDNFLKF